MRYEEMTITPDMAKRFLEKNSVNRKLNPARANQYASDMKNGEWQLNGEAIKFYEDGSLCDGQHRLTAVIKGEVPLKTLVIFGVPNTVSVQDRGRNRSLTDSMLLEGFDAALANNTIVAVAKLHFVVQNRHSTNVSDGDAKRFIDRNQNILASLMHNSPRKNHGQKSQAINSKNAPTLLASFYALNCGECDESSVFDFLRILSSGIPEKLDQSAALVCRNDMLSGAISIAGATQSRIKAEYQFEKAIQDFCNHYPRKLSYSSWNQPIYSTHEKNKEA